MLNQYTHGSVPISIWHTFEVSHQLFDIFFKV